MVGQRRKPPEGFGQSPEPRKVFGEVKSYSTEYGTEDRFFSIGKKDPFTKLAEWTPLGSEYDWISAGMGQGGSSKGGGGDGDSTLETECHKFRRLRLSVELRQAFDAATGKIPMIGVSIRGFDKQSGICSVAVPFLCDVDHMPLKVGDNTERTEVKVYKKDGSNESKNDEKCGRCPKKDKEEKVEKNAFGELLSSLSDEQWELFRSFMDGICGLGGVKQMGDEGLMFRIDRICYKKKNNWECGKYKGDACQSPKKLRRFGKPPMMQEGYGGSVDTHWDTSKDPFASLVDGVPTTMLCGLWWGFPSNTFGKSLRECLFEDGADGKPGNGPPRPDIGNKIKKCFDDFLPKGTLEDMIDEAWSFIIGGFDQDAYMLGLLKDIKDCVCGAMGVDQD